MSAPDTPDSRAAPVWRRRSDVVWRRSLDAVILFPPGADDAMTLTDPGAVVWDLLEQPATLDELVDTLVQLYAGDRSTIEHDLRELLVGLHDRHAVVSA